MSLNEWLTILVTATSTLVTAISTLVTVITLWREEAERRRKNLQQRALLRGSREAKKEPSAAQAQTPRSERKKEEQGI